MSVRDYRDEVPGLRHGRLTILDREPEYRVYGKVKRLALWARCDCGRDELVEKRRLVERPGPCSECKAEAKTQAEARRRPKLPAGRRYGRDYETEAPGTRYGSRVVMARPPEYQIFNGVKKISLWMRCDCGQEALVVKYALLVGRSIGCRRCSAINQPNVRGKPWTDR